MGSYHIRILSGTFWQAYDSVLIAILFSWFRERYLLACIQPYSCHKDRHSEKRTLWVLSKKRILMKYTSVCQISVLNLVNKVSTHLRQLTALRLLFVGCYLLQEGSFCWQKCRFGPRSQNQQLDPIPFQTLQVMKTELETVRACARRNNHLLRWISILHM